MARVAMSPKLSGASAANSSAYVTSASAASRSTASRRSPSPSTKSRESTPSAASTQTRSVSATSRSSEVPNACSIRDRRSSGGGGVRLASQSPTVVSARARTSSGRGEGTLDDLRCMLDRLRELGGVRDPRLRQVRLPTPTTTAKGSDLAHERVGADSLLAQIVRHHDEDHGLVANGSAQDSDSASQLLAERIGERLELLRITDSH